MKIKFYSRLKFPNNLNLSTTKLLYFISQADSKVRNTSSYSENSFIISTFDSECIGTVIQLSEFVG